MLCKITYTMYKFRRAVCGLWRTDGFTADEICHYRGIGVGASVH